MSQTAKTAYSVETIPHAKVKTPYGTNARIARHAPCALCGSASRQFGNADSTAVDCDACGRYLISDSAEEAVGNHRADGSWTKSDSGFVSGFIRYNRAPGKDADWVHLTTRTFDHLKVPRRPAARPAVNRSATGAAPHAV